MCNTCTHRSLHFDVKHSVIHVFGHLSQKSRNLSYGACMHTLCVLHETFGNFIGTTMKHADCRNYIGKIWDQTENVRRSYKMFIANTYSFKN